VSACTDAAGNIYLKGKRNYFKGKLRVRTYLAIACATGLLLSGCSINDDLRSYQTSVPERVRGLAWLELAPLGAFAQLSPDENIPDARNLAQKAADLRRRAAAIRGPVLDPIRASAMRAALSKLASR